MSTSSDYSSNSSSSVTDVDQALEYYEELDTQTLDLKKRLASRSIPTKTFSQGSSTLTSRAPPPPPILDPIQELNEELNRQFRPDLVPPSSVLPPVSSQSINKQTLSPVQVIFDAHAKPVKSLNKNKKEPSLSIKQRFFNSIHRLTHPTETSTSSPKLNISNQRTTMDSYHVPQGMMLVPAPQQQPQQLYSNTTQYNPPTVNLNTSYKNNKVAPPPVSLNNTQMMNHTFPSNSFQSPSSAVSTNLLLQSSSGLKQQQQQKHLFKHIDQSKSNKKKQRRDSDEDAKNANRTFALYNQQNGRIEGVVKNRLHVATDDDMDESRILDDDTEPRSNTDLWCSQPLCLGLTRLSGGILFGAMIILACASIAGLIASIVLYTQDSVTDAQWKILGMVVCAIMLIAIIITLLLFICCYKQGYMFDKDDELDPTDPTTTQDAEGNERQKAVLRKIYKFNRPNDSPPVPVHMPRPIPRSPTPPPPKPVQQSVLVSDKQTNTDTTISTSRPRDFDRGVWPSMNAYGGIAYLPLIPPQMTSRVIQVLPHEIEQAMQPPAPVIYQVVQPPPVQQRIIQVPSQQPTLIEYVETTQKSQPKVIQVISQDTPEFEYVETKQKKQQPRIIQAQTRQSSDDDYVETKHKQQTRVIQVPVQQTTDDEYIEPTPKQTRTKVIRQAPSNRIEYVDNQRSRRVVQQPEYEIVQEVMNRSTSSPIEEMIEIVDAPHKRSRRHGRKKDKRQRGVVKVSVKHLKSAHD